MSKALFESLLHRTYPKGIGYAFAYRVPGISIEEQRKNKLFIFLKHFSSLAHDPKEVKLHTTWPIKYEVELGLLINKTGRRIAKEDALYHVGGYLLLIDFTSMENAEARKRGESWCIYKNDINFMPVSNLIEKNLVKNPDNLELELKINGQTKQKVNTSELIYNVPELISHSSQYMTLNEGDIILTGTPAGSDILKQDDRVYATLKQDNEILTDLNFKVKLGHHHPDTPSSDDEKQDRN